MYAIVGDLFFARNVLETQFSRRSVVEAELRLLSRENLPSIHHLEEFVCLPVS
jgi:hypothetical protein